MIPYISIKTANAANYFDSFELAEDDIERFEILMEDEYDQEAQDIFMEEFITPAALKYQELMSSYLNQADAGPMRDKDQDKLTRNITLLSLGLSNLLSYNFNKYLERIHSKFIFDKADIKDKETKKSIADETISEFDQLISGTMARTQGFIISGIRTLQREMIAENLLLKNSGISGDLLEAEILRFKESLRIKYPEIYNAANKGNLMTTSKFVDGVEVTRHYKLDYYIDLSIRTTLLNIDRNANAISALVNGENVVEYYLADPRDVKKDRELCQKVLATKTNGLSLLALDDDTAKKLGIMTVDEAKSTPDYCMGPLCRHSIRRCDKKFLRGINNGD